MIKANLIWANESNKVETLEDSDCLLILTTPELLASQLFHFSTPAKTYIEQVFNDENFSGNKGQCVFVQGLKAFKTSYISDNENSGQNKISQQLAEVKRVLFYGVDFALFEASDAPSVSSRSSTLSKTNDPSMVNRSSYASDSNSAFNSKSTSDLSQTNAPAFRYLEQQFDALFKKLKSVSVTLEKLSLMALSTAETASSDPVNVVASHSQFLSALLRSYFKHGYHFKGYKTNNRSVSNSQPLNDNINANNEAINQAIDIRGTLSLALDAKHFNTAQKRLASHTIRYESALNDAMTWSKDLAHMPANLCTPYYLAEQAQHLAQTFSTVSCDILNESTLQQLGMNGYLAVNAGSQFAASMPVLRYAANGLEDAPPVVLIGKGVTFDSGGITLKRSPDMRHMIYDMAGAGCVLGVIQAVATLGLNVNIIGIVASADNAIDGKAYRPGDIIAMHAGKTVEVMSTDAEGRMLMADAISYAKQFSPSVIIDVATLTGAAISALGHKASALFSNAPALESALVEAGEQANDRCWPFPLWPEYQDAITSQHADMMNTGINSPGAISAGCFLSRFADGTPWAHLDVAGTAFTYTKSLSATGRPIPLLLSYLSSCAIKNNQ
ncbi:multifunctional aminopeptidase A [Alteromonas mediterranea MED64]|uniref:leucyl aminopeptidase n=1 Tax=Alteromonas mediterranea TaxID=314275 RepID=UPI0003555D6B|nr:leucyl aminopeptidase [Alteromonas mediterranea]AGP83050.1 multifunctional aminopeptidase A [Alteromonas mediterranea MED64]